MEFCSWQISVIRKNLPSLNGLPRAHIMNRIILSEEEYQEYRNAKVLSAGEEIYHQNGFVIFGYESNEMLLSVAQG